MTLAKLRRSDSLRAVAIGLALLCFLGNPPAPAAAPLAAPPLPDRFDVPAIDAFLEGQVRQAARVGLSVAIVKDGRVALAKGYGKSSLADGKEVDPETLFAIGSVTKQFTCAALLLLAEQGKLSVHDPVAKYYPALTRAQDITLLDLMNHTSGYADYYPLDFVDRRMQRRIAPEELLRIYAGAKLDFEPGTRWSYSNTGFILLGRVVEKVSGESFGAFLARSILEPLGMDHTVYEPPTSDRRLAWGYTTFALSSPEAVEPEAGGWIGAAGGIYSTPSDLAKWNLALIDGKLLKPQSYALMTTPRRLSSGRLTDYGCGLLVRTQSGRQVLSHSGAVSGYNASSAFIPSTRSCVILLCNVDGGLGPLPGQLLSLLLKDISAVPQVTGPPAVEMVKTLFGQLQKGRVNRLLFGADFNEYLTDARVVGAARRLKRYGAPKSVEMMNTNERGGMEVTVTRLSFKSGTLRSLMYRMPNGKVEQFFVYAE